MLVITTPERRDGLIGEVAAAAGEGLFVTGSSGRFVEILRGGIDKGAGLRVLAGHLGIPVTSWIAVGDDLNDLHMLEAAGLGVAVAGAGEDVRRVADKVIGNLWEGGAEELAGLLEA
jgi:hydroxymethylpyrimidine pyrophosphatase-like HAD family hydrolase